MRVLITGGTGFLGRRLIIRLLADGMLAGRKIERILAADILGVQQALPDDPRLEVVRCDTADPARIDGLIADRTDVVFHLASAVSAAAEQDFSLGLRVNVFGTLHLLEACRRSGRRPLFLFTSSLAAYGAHLPDVVRDDTTVRPLTSYGTQKVVGEVLVNDYTRKDFIDGRSFRLPIVIVRPGKPNPAASAWVSSIVREPLQGEQAVLPVSPECRVWVLSPRRVIDALVAGAAMPSDRFGQDRTIALPGLSCAAGEILAALQRVAGSRVVDRVRHERDPFVERIVQSWPSRFDPRRALECGFTADSSVDDIVRQFIDDDLGGAFVA